MPEVADILKEASQLDLTEKTELVSSLLEELSPSPHHVSDDGALKRKDELLEGKVKGLSDEEFWKACGRTPR
jgi:hypothetical protein